MYMVVVKKFYFIHPSLLTIGVEVIEGPIWGVMRQNGSEIWSLIDGMQFVHKPNDVFNYSL